MKNTHRFLIAVAAVALFASAAVALVGSAGQARAGSSSCCAAAPLASISAEDKKADNTLMEPVKSVLDHYLKIQGELAQDSIKGVDDQASAIAKAVKGDEMKMLSPEVATQADTLAQAKDLKTARDAFKPLSASLVKYLADNKAGVGAYHEAYCPMVRANWLQTGKAIKNPYMGKAMLTCGELKN